MIETKYYECYQKWKHVEELRREMAEYAKKYGATEAALKFGTTTTTVRKWVKRQKNHESMQDRSKRPKSSPNRIKANVEKTLVDSAMYAILNHKRYNASYLRESLSVAYSVKTVIKVLRCHNLYARILKKKPERKRDLREIKKLLKVFEKIQVDVKYLTDIPEMIKELWEYDLPRFQYTARCVRSGALFFCYSKSYNVKNSTVFAELVLSHLERNGIDLTGITIQTDNGTEFVNRYKITDFVAWIRLRSAKYRSIPPGAKTWQSDVESSHRLIEEEFYSREIIRSRNDFFEQAADYQHHFNYERLNRYKGGTPWDIATSLVPTLPESALQLKPVFLEDFADLYHTISANLQKFPISDTISG